MKNRWIVFILLLGSGSLSGQTSQDMQIHDTRDINLLPNVFHWSSSYAYKARVDFKYNHIVGMPGSGVYSTVLTIPQWPDNSGDKMHQLGFNNGGVFFRQGWPSGAIWEGWRKVLVEDENGNIGIGTSTPSEKLSVNGNIRAKKIIVSQTGWPDYVFNTTYHLKPLSELEKFIQKNQHLPEVPSAYEVEKKGINVGDS